MDTTARSSPVLADRQREALVSFERDCAERESAIRLGSTSREARLDAARRLEVVRREREAALTRSRLGGRAVAVRGRPKRRALVALGHAWFADQLVELLEGAGLDVVMRTDNGADAIGAAVAEQPDLIVVDGSLQMVTADEVVRELRRYCSAAVIAARVGTRHAAVMRDAGADTVISLRLTPQEAVDECLARVASA